MLGHAVSIAVIFGAGVVTGVYIREKEVVKVEDIKNGAKWLFAKVTGNGADCPQPQPARS